MIKKKIFIATGGTGGHVFPAYSLANFLTKNNYDVKITLDKRGYQFLKDYKDLRIVKISSSPLVSKNILVLFLSFLKILFSIFQSLIFLIFNRPHLIFGMGGYSSFPVCIAAAILRIKFFIYENNLIIGKANKYLLPFSSKVFVSYKDLEGVPPKNRKKVIEIGNIIREELIKFESKNISDYSFESLEILILGGSQAAKTFAEVLPPIFKRIKKLNIPVKIYQQCQKEQTKTLKNFYKEANIDSEIFNFTSNIKDYYSKANLVITRSGASALGELLNVKIPFICIPLPSSAEDHQTKNAIFYEERGLGYLVMEKDINNNLLNLINSIYEKNSLVEKILINQSQYSDKNVFDNIKTHIEGLINEKN